MSYEVLARKWRPLTFDEVVGQDHITRTLKKAVETGRISHAYMFAGPRGCGKTSTARILARVINCENLPGDGNPCNECASCRAVIHGSNLDVMEIDGASHTGVAEVRDLQESIGYAPSQFRSKVYIIDEVHMLSAHAFNALLKTLEEPPRHVYFVFATTAPHKIPETIKSRCQRHHFKRLEINAIADQLRVICEAEKVRFDSDGLRLLARKADGSMRDGTSLLDQCITSSDGNVTTESVRDILGMIDQEKVFGFMRSIASADPTEALKLLHECVDEGIDTQELSAALLEGYRDLMLLSTPGDLSDLLYRSDDEIELLRGFLPSYELPDLVTIVERMCDVVPRLKTAADPKITLESMLVDLALLERQVDIRQIIEDLDSPRGGGGSREDRSGKAAGAPRTKGGGSKRRKETAAADDTSEAAGGGAVSGSARTAPSTGIAMAIEPDSDRTGSDEDSRAPGTGEGELNEEKLGELWDGFVTFVRQKRFRLGVCLISGKFESFDGNTLALRFAKSFVQQKVQVEKAENIRYLKRMMQTYFGREAEIVCEVEGEARRRVRNRTQKTPDTPVDGLRGISDEKRPLVEKLIEEFDGEIVRYKP
jgi:DNA polymerase-3 subunit gamma/tau